MKRLFFIIAIFFSGIQLMVAQYDAQFSNYWAVMNYFNPAHAGTSGELEATALYRMQWVGIDGAPQTGLITADMPMSFLGKTHGIGVVLYTENIGLFSHQIASGQFAWKKSLWKGVFSAGFQVGYIKESFKGSEIGKEQIPPGDEYHEGTDPSIPTTNVSGSAIDMAFGLMYTKPKWYVGMSVTHLTSPQLKLNENTFEEIPRAYYFTAGYNIQLSNPLLELRPMLLVKATETSPYSEPDSIASLYNRNSIKAMMTMTQVDLSVRMIYNKTFWGGLGWRKGDAAVVSLGGKFKVIEAGYAYDFPISTIIKGSSGSHELFLKYIVDLNKKKGNRNKHKSVRIL